MSFPLPTDFIDAHTHGSSPVSGVFAVETLMAHEKRLPYNSEGMAFTSGIHPWYLNVENHDELLSVVEDTARSASVIAVGEAGYDKLKGPGMELQKKAFEEQVEISEKYGKPLVIHCVRAWEELLETHRRFRPKLPWLIHGFRGKYELAMQLISKNMYISFWYEFVLRQEAAQLVKKLPSGRIFLETDGSGANIRDIYNKVSVDLGTTVGELKYNIHSNFLQFFSALT